MIRAITFDFWNTLFVGISADRLRCDRIREVLVRAGRGDVPEERITAAIRRAWQAWDRVWEAEQRTFGAPHWITLVLADLEVQLSTADHEGLVEVMTTSGMEAEPPLVEGLAELLPRLARRYRLGLISDTGLSPGRHLRQHMRAHGVLGYFSHLTFSDELGVSKPHPDAFLTTLEALGVPPQAAVHVGDYPRTDVAGARAVGMRAVQFTGVREWPAEGIQPHARIDAYDALEPLLARWDR